MTILKAIFSGCFDILQTSVNLFGYSISLLNVFVYGFVGSILLLIYFKMTK